MSRSSHTVLGDMCCAGVKTKDERDDTYINTYSASSAIVDRTHPLVLLYYDIGLPCVTQSHEKSVHTYKKVLGGLLNFVHRLTRWVFPSKIALWECCQYATLRRIARCGHVSSIFFY